MASASRRQVRRKVEMPGGAAAATALIVSSSITPGPLGISETRPSAAAPDSTASRASSVSRMQQTFTRTGADGTDVSAFRARDATGQRADVIGEELVVERARPQPLEVEKRLRPRQAEVGQGGGHDEVR